MACKELTHSAEQHRREFCPFYLVLQKKKHNAHSRRSLTRRSKQSAPLHVNGEKCNANPECGKRAIYTHLYVSFQACNC